MLEKIKNMSLKKKFGGKEIIIEVGLAVVGVALLIVFREQATSLVKTLVSNTSSQISNLFKAL